MLAHGQPLSFVYLATAVSLAKAAWWKDRTNLKKRLSRTIHNLNSDYVGLKGVKFKLLHLGALVKREN